MWTATMMTCPCRRSDLASFAPIAGRSAAMPGRTGRTRGAEWERFDERDDWKLGGKARLEKDEEIARKIGNVPSEAPKPVEPGSKVVPLKTPPRPPKIRQAD